MKIAILYLLSLALLTIPSRAQEVTDSLPADSMAGAAPSLPVDSFELSVDDYNKYTPFVGGEEFRMRNGLKINGMVKDYYPDSTLKHKGYYQNGQLVSTFKNYYPNGKLERSFSASGNFKLIIQRYYFNGTPREYLEYHKGELVKYIDYYPNGKIATFEERDKKKGFYITFKNYYEDGTLQDELVLKDKKTLSYYKREYYPNGTIKEEGPVQFNKAQYDYQKHGTWKIYDKSGKLIEQAEYYKGALIL
jgi:antitoxin component YwqK of YwqJK toxin-antitoxin module